MTTNTKDPTQEVILRVTGMHCASCVGRVERMLSKVEGVHDVMVSLPSERAIIQGDNLDAQQLASVIDNLGFNAAPLTPASHHHSEHQHPHAPAEHASLPDHAAHDHAQHIEESIDPWLWRVIVGIAIVVPLKLLHWFTPALNIPMGAAIWASALLGTTAALIVGWPFFVSACKALRTRAATMDTLVALGASAALIVSWDSVITWIRTGAHPPLYFAEAAALLTLIGIGRLLESRLNAITTTDTRALLEAQPDHAQLITSPEENQGRLTPTAHLKPNDLVLVPTGERVPVDGVIARGSSAFDEAVVTGESIPVDRTINDPVVAGALNTGPAIVVRAAVDGTSTTIARIAAMIERARASKVPMQALADRITAAFVPIILTIAAAAFLGWWLLSDKTAAEAAIIAATVLVIACPCALGLATPLAVMAGVGGAAKQGVFLRDAAALQRGAKVRTVVFDKTGTLTAGQPRVVAASDEALALAASVCAASSHPIARAIVEAANQRRLTIAAAESIEEQAGAGMVGQVAGSTIRILSEHAARQANLLSAGADIPSEVPGSTVSLVFRDHQLLGPIALRDQPRPDAAAAIRALKQAGIATRMLSGDRAEAAHAIGQEVGLTAEEISAQLTPQDKLAAITQWSTDPAAAPVAMVGDGINDAPALAEASARGGVAIAIGTGTAAAIESADAIAPGDKLTAVPALLRVASSTVAAIKTNLTLAFLYNAAAVPIAALGFLGEHGPLVAAIAMALSNACVVTNSALLALRLRRHPAPTP